MRLSYALLTLLVILGFPVFAQKRVVCYLSSWSANRKGDGKFTLEDIDPKLCTHVIYAFIGLNADGTVLVNNHAREITEGGFKKFNSLRSKNPNLKTMVAISDESTKFSKVCNDLALRTTFVANLFNFVRQYNFSGLDVDWEYPAQKGGIPIDKQNFVSLIKELKAKFEPAGLVLSAAVNAGPWAGRISYDVPQLAQYLDFFNLMMYDIYGGWDSTTGFNAPLSEVKGFLNYWIGLGVDKSKLCLGVPLYGRTFTLANMAATGFGSSSLGSGNKGPWSGEAGVLLYNEFCMLRKTQSRWTEVWNVTDMVPFYYRRDQWVSHENIRSVQAKGDLAKTNSLGGVMVWALDMDDFKNTCGGGNYPLMNNLRTAYGV